MPAARLLLAILCPPLLCAAAACVLAAGEGGKAPLPSLAELPVRPELPDPLVTLDGRKVTSRKQWEKERRPELKRLFQHYMYGTPPPPPREIRAAVRHEDRQAFGGKATLREITLRFGPEGTPPLYLLLVLPNEREGPAPVFVGPNFSGNHTLVSDPHVRIPEGWMYPNYPGVTENRATEAGRGALPGVWNLERAVDRGYAVATFYNGDVEPDQPGSTKGVRHAYATGEYDWGAVSAWAWGIQRAVDYLRKRPEIDRGRIISVGHSRNGKAALLAAAFDERIAMAIPLQAGSGGTAPSRGKVGESVKQINDRFPHWFNDRFKQFNDQPERLPFDQNALVALMAPRPVLFPNASEDTWANPAGQFDVLKAAEPVYRLYGLQALGAAEMPGLGTLVNSPLGYFIRPGKHSMTGEDWGAFLEYADRQLGAGREPAAR